MWNISAAIVLLVFAITVIILIGTYQLLSDGVLMDACRRQGWFHLSGIDCVSEEARKRKPRVDKPAHSLPPFSRMCAAASDGIPRKITRPCCLSKLRLMMNLSSSPASLRLRCRSRPVSKRSCHLFMKVLHSTQRVSSRGHARNRLLFAS